MLECDVCGSANTVAGADCYKCLECGYERKRGVRA